jgi:putative DNA primase/helicase
MDPAECEKEFGHILKAAFAGNGKPTKDAKASTPPPPRFRVSTVRNAKATDCEDRWLNDVVDDIRDGKHDGGLLEVQMAYTKAFSEALTLHGDEAAAHKAGKKAASEAKKRLPAILFSGTFEKRSNNGLEHHSGLLCADVDDICDMWERWELASKLKEDPHVIMVAESPTGTGLKVVFRVSDNPLHHGDSFRAVEARMRDIYGVEIDPSCKDVARMCFVPDGVNLYFNPYKGPLPLLPPEEATKTPAKAPEHSLTTSPSNGDTSKRKEIAESLLGPLRSIDGRWFCDCPGKDLHTTGDGAKDCEVHLDGAPNIHCHHEHCSSAVAATNKTLQSEIGKAEAGEIEAATGEAEPWSDPEPLKGLPDVESFPLESLPGTLRPWLKDISERMNCPPDFAAIGAICAASAICGRKVAIRPKAADDWGVIPNLWGMIVGRPSVMKTPALKAAMAPLEKLSAEALEKYREEENAFAVDEAMMKQRQKVAEVKIKAYLEEGREADARYETECLQRSESDKPVLHRYKTSDITVEKLEVLLEENPNGLMVFRDEMMGWFTSLEKENQQPARAFYLECYDGWASYTSDRIGRGRTEIKGLCLSIMGSIQPGPLQTYVRQAVRGGNGSDGLLQRFALMVWPDIGREPWQDVDRQPDNEAARRAFDAFRHLDTLTAETVGAEPDPHTGVPFLRFTPEARVRFVEWREHMENHVIRGAEHEALESHLTKYRKLVPALALLFHLLDRQRGAVTLEALDRALVITRYLGSHARRVYSAATHKGAVPAEEIARHIQARDLPCGDSISFTARDIKRKHWQGLGTDGEVEAGIAALVDSGWLREIPKKEGRGRPTEHYEVNPKIYQEPPKTSDKSDKNNAEGNFGTFGTAIESGDKKEWEDI